MRKIIFLDVDGVMNSLRNAKANYDKAMEKQVNVYDYFDPIAVRELNRICGRHDPDIVISSTWRRVARFRDDFQSLRDHFAGQGFEHSDRIIDKTPFLSSRERGHEIQAWLDQNCKGQDVKFVIIDDDRDMAHLEPFLVRTGFRYGLTVKKAAEVIRRLR
jgi:hypothetical protein